MTAYPEEGVVEDGLDRARRTRVLVVGDVMLDRYLIGSVDRVSPEAPVPVVRARGRRSAPGGAANVAAGARALGAEVDVVGVVGPDAAAERLGVALEKRGIGTGGLVRAPRRSTTTKLRVVAEHQQMLRIDREDDTPVTGETAAALERRALERLDEADVLVFQDYDKGALTPPLIRTLMERAGEAGIPTVVDPKLRNFFEYAGAVLFKPNANELARAFGEEVTARDAQAWARRRARIGCRHLLVTLGARGMCLMAEGTSAPSHIPSRARDVYDVSGAGDTVTATLAVGLAAGLEIPDAAWLANAAAGLSVARFGARPVTREALAREVAAARASARDDGGSGPGERVRR